MTTYRLTPQRKRLLLIAGLVIALLITVFFAVRVIGRVRNRPTLEPIRSWQSLGYIARAYGVSPRVLEDALGLPPGPPPDRRPIAEIATAQGKTTDEVIAILQAAIEKARPPRPPDRPGRDPPERRLQTAEPAGTATP